MSIKAIKRRHVKKYLPQTVEELNWYREQSSLRSAVELAALAIDRKGKRHAHQRRLSRSALEKAKEVLVANTESLERAKDFDGLIHLIKALLDSVTGIGELYVYDTSLRIGARLGLSPEKVYLHA